tara:strand:- start:2238 stop:2483 length:246 start_codon:yes stop_codon:yes gene_type:complete
MELLNIVDDDIDYRSRNKIQVLQPDGSHLLGVELKKVYIYHGNPTAQYRGMQIEQLLQSQVISQREADNAREHLSYSIVEI